jgi:hypothetical protein
VLVELGLVEQRYQAVLERRQVHVVEFAASLGYDLVASTGKSRDAVRTIDLDNGLVRVLRVQRKLQAAERLASERYEESDYVFTRPTGVRITPTTSRSCSAG